MVRIIMVTPASESEIRARRHLNETPFRLEIGRKYRFDASGRWTDLIRRASATGYSACYLRWFERWRRMPEAKWFSVIGQIDDLENTQFDIGKLIENRGSYEATATGVLHCFANDISFMYWNNSGAINLRVEGM